MIIEKPEDTRFLPSGDLVFEKDHERFSVNIDDYYTACAAEHLIANGFDREVFSQADIIANAVNFFQWGLGASNFIAIANEHSQNIASTQTHCAE